MNSSRKGEGGGVDYSGKSVLIYAMNYFPEMIGAGRYSGELGDALAAQGARVEVITTPPHYPGWRVSKPYRSWAYGVDRKGTLVVYRCPLVLRKKMRGVWRALAPFSFAATSFPVAIWRLIVHRPDVLFCVMPTLLSAPVAAFLGRLLGVRTVLHVQDLEIDAAFAVGHLGRSGGLLKFALSIERLCLRAFDEIVTISEAMRVRLLVKNVPEEKISVIRNWVDLNHIYPVEGKNPYRTELSIPDSTFIVQYAGNIGAKQGLDTLLDAAELLQSTPEILILIVGEGPERDVLMERYGHLPNVRFLGLQPEDKLRDLLNLADVHVITQIAGAADLVLPSKLGGILASSRPLIATVEPDRELGQFLDGAAILVPPGNPRAIAEAIEAASKQEEDHGRDGRLALANKLASETQLSRFGAVIFGE